MKAGTFTNTEQTPGFTIYEKGTPGELEVIHYISKDGFETMLTHWYPSAEDIRDMINGKPVALHIVGERHPWVRVEVAK